MSSAPPDFQARDRSADVARRYCRQQLDIALSHEPGVRTGTDIEDVHQMRVAIRRLRAALRAFAPCLDRPRARALRAELGWLGRALGEVRDLDVQLEAVAAWRKELGAAPAPGWKRLEQTLQLRHRAARPRLLEALDSPRYQQLIDRARALIARGDRDRRAAKSPVALLAAKTLERRIKAFRRAIELSREKRDAESVHRCRIAGKALRYTAELFSPLYPRSFARTTRRLKRFQDELGRLQDRVVAAELAARLQHALRAGATAADAADSEGDAAYAFVLGQLAGRGLEAAAHGPLLLEHQLQRLGDDKAIRSLADTAAKAATAARAGRGAKR